MSPSSGVSTASLLFLLLPFLGLAAGERPLPLSNPGFEEGLAGWTIGGDDPGLAVAAESAASLGRRGLRVTVPPGAVGFTVDSAPLPVTPGKTYRVEFWQGGGRPGAKGVQVEMVFLDAAGAPLTPARASIRKWPAIQVSGGVFFTNPTLAAAAPPGAATLTLRVKPYGRDGGGPVDLDDFRVFELTDDDAPKPALAPGQGNPIPPSDPARLAALLDEIRADPRRGKAPPKIVIKLDDFKPSHGGVHPRWLRVADFAAERKIKVGFGIIAQTLEADSPEFFAWTRARHTSGAIEFWFHGYDHSQSGDLREFSGRPYDYQKQHVVDSQRLAREKLGFAFRSFGAPFNAVDATAAQAIGEDPDLAVWMYGKPGETGGKLALERAYAVNLESPTIIANHGAFLEGYAHNRGAAYFVLQGHPAGWGDDRYAEFVKIVDFLISQKAEFVHAAEFADRPDLRALLR
jgi:hypothetical protein